MKAALLDREGTVIIDPDYDRVDSVEKIRLLPHTLNALTYLADHGFSIILITNQTNIAQGRITEEEFWKINDAVLRLLKPSGVKVLKTYVCPHDTDDNCDCRKPKPSMLLQAAEEFNLDSASTYMIGDRVSDIEAGVNAGMKAILVKTGKHSAASDIATHTAVNLLEAVEHIVRQG
jgi:D-glycero-D-manno-heptose 1,7-bisphosphate phosphatase